MTIVVFVVRKDILSKCWLMISACSIRRFHEKIQGALLKIDVSDLIPNLKEVNAALACYLQEGVA